MSLLKLFCLFLIRPYSFLYQRKKKHLCTFGYKWFITDINIIYLAYKLKFTGRVSLHGFRAEKIRTSVKKKKKKVKRESNC